MLVAAPPHVAPTAQCFDFGWFDSNRRRQEVQQPIIVGVYLHPSHSDHGCIGERQRRRQKHIAGHQRNGVFLKLAITLHDDPVGCSKLIDG